MPYNIALFCLILAIWTGSKTRKKRFLISGLLILILISNQPLVNWAFNIWEVPASDIKSLPQSNKVGVLLSGGLVSWSTHHTDHLGMGYHADRFMQAYQLYRQNKIGKILITGTNSSWIMQGGMGEVNQVKKWLVEWGVPAEDIILEEKARNTRENALYTKQILDKSFPNQEYILITSAFHMRRAEACFNKIGVRVTVFPANFYGGDYDFSLKDVLVPDATSVGYLSLLWREWVGYVAYRLVGYV